MHDGKRYMKPTILFAAFMFFCAVLTSSPHSQTKTGAVGAEFRDGLEWPPPWGQVPLEFTPQEPDYLPLLGLSASLPGDSLVYSFCLKGIIQFATFGGSDVWGYTAPDNTDYAIMGIDVGLVFVDATNLQVVDTVFGPINGCGGVRWRDMVTVGNICYAVSECTGTNQGIMIIDMSFLPDSVHFIKSIPTSNFGSVTSHNVAIDSVAGFLYVEGFFGANTSIFIFNIANTANPVFVAGFGPVSGSIHDMYADNDTLYVAEGSASTFSIWDMANKTSPALLARVMVPGNGFVHNIWPTDDRRHVVTTEETAFRTVKIWNREDLNNITLVGEYLAGSQLAHNAQVKGDTLYLSHYESGLRVVDISDATAPREIARFDTWPFETPGFNGAWGMYPFSPNGYVYGSNDDGKLFILQEAVLIIDETLVADTVGSAPGSSLRLDISVANSRPIHLMNIPFSWQGPSNIQLDSVSRVGTRTENFEKIEVTSINPFGREAAYKLTASTSGNDNDMPAGDGVVLSLHFTVPGGAVDGVNPLLLGPVNGITVQFSDICGTVTSPNLTTGSITVCQACGSCCVAAGDANHDSSINIADVTFLIARIFAGGASPVCNDEADANADNTTNIADVTFLISRIFAGGPAPSCGATGT